MIPGFASILNDSERFIAALGLNVEKAVWILPEESHEWKLVLVMPDKATAPSSIYGRIIDTLDSMNPAVAFESNDIRVEKTDEVYERSLPYRIVRTGRT